MVLPNLLLLIRHGMWVVLTKASIVILHATIYSVTLAKLEVLTMLSAKTLRLKKALTGNSNNQGLAIKLIPPVFHENAINQSTFID